MANATKLLLLIGALLIFSICELANPLPLNSNPDNTSSKTPEVNSDEFFLLHFKPYEVENKNTDLIDIRRRSIQSENQKKRVIRQIDLGYVGFEPDMIFENTKDALEQINDVNLNNLETHKFIISDNSIRKNKENSQSYNNLKYTPFGEISSSGVNPKNDENIDIHLMGNELTQNSEDIPLELSLAKANNDLLENEIKEMQQTLPQSRYRRQSEPFIRPEFGYGLYNGPGGFGGFDQPGNPRPNGIGGQNNGQQTGFGQSGNSQSRPNGIGGQNNGQQTGFGQSGNSQSRPNGIGGQNNGQQTGFGQSGNSQSRPNGIGGQNNGQQTGFGQSGNLQTQPNGIGGQNNDQQTGFGQSGNSQSRPGGQNNRQQTGQGQTGNSLNQPNVGQFGGQTSGSQLITTQRPPLNTIASETMLPQAQCISRCQSTTQYRPICGSDGTTYTNSGRLACAQQCGRNVTALYEGACISSTT